MKAKHIIGDLVVLSSNKPVVIGIIIDRLPSDERLQAVYSVWWVSVGGLNWKQYYYSDEIQDFKNILSEMIK